MRFSTDDILRFARWSGDRNPLHVDPDFARLTHFGQPIVHGVFTALRAVDAAGLAGLPAVTAIDIEFRSAATVGEDYAVLTAADGADVVVTLTGGAQTVLTARLETDVRSASAAPDLSWIPGSDRALRDQSVARRLDEFEAGVEVLGKYSTTASGDAGPWLSHTQRRVLALCSYVVGMELPGVRSLFTRLTVRFAGPADQDPELRFRARTTRWDRTFRLLDTEIVVATPAGDHVATATVRSYVPFSPMTPDVELLEGAVRSVADNLRDRVALVIGGSRGVGAEIAAALALGGCRVYATGRSGSGRWIDALAARGARVHFLEGDAGDPSWCESTRARLMGEHGRLDILVLNACAPPGVLRLGPETRVRHASYVRENLALVETPLATFADALEQSGGRVVCMSSVYVTDAPAGFSHYVAVKRAAEGLVHTLCRERRTVAGVIVRPPQLQTRWNDTPAGVVSSIPAHRAAIAAVQGVARADGAGAVALITEFPPLDVPETAGPTAPEFTVRVSATFTTDPLLAPLQRWLKELEINGAVTAAPYGQVLQSLLNPGSELNTGGRGLNVVFVRVRDWLRDLPDEQAGDIEFIRGYLQEAQRDLAQACRTHRSHASSETLLVVCPSHGALSSAENILIRQTEQELVAACAEVPGLQALPAAEYHQHYSVDEDDVFDALRDEIAHIPYIDDYWHVLAALVARQVHRRLVPVRKVVVVDCDNTLWRGVVGEVGADGVEFDDGHVALHRTLERLAASGVLVCLCSKNEEADVWRVFDTRTEMALGRESIVAAIVNWRPKSQNLRTLAARLNLGLDSFIFLDDNPIECAEVRSGCPEVLTIQWPQDARSATRLLQHIWEFDPRTATKEDARRTEMYKDEFRRQELRSATLTFEDFINNLQLVVDIRPLTEEDVRRAAQLTLRTNQFNFTTIRRDEADLQALRAGGRHEIRTVRVRDRFGDYGLVGLVIVERGDAVWTVDTFLLSCRVLGRGAEHRIMADVGAMALAAGAKAVRLGVITTARNRPARAFLESIVPKDLRHENDAGVRCDVPAQQLAAVQFDPAATGEVIVQDETSATASMLDPDRLRRREEQIARCAVELWSGPAIRASFHGDAPPRAGAAALDAPDVADVVRTTFARVLRMTPEQVAETDRLESLGCDSLKIVEITVALSEKYPWLPGTLLFEHPRVSDIVREIQTLASAQSTRSGIVSPKAEAAPATSRASAAASDMAVVGLHLRCAGADSPDQLWDLLSRGASAVSSVPENRKFFLQPLSDGRPHWAGLLDDPARFDAEVFGVAPREAEFMDPQLRLFLEVAWNALEDAGCLGDDHDDNTGVFAGVMYGDYATRANLAPAAHANPYRCWEGFSLANRLSQLLGFNGPSLAVDTACSSSATALHLACAALEAGDCRVAVVGGVNLILDPDRFASLGRLGILSPRGRCEPFGADADGTVLGEGAGVVVLRPLTDALARGDRIYGVIKGTGISTGNGTVGFTAPNPQAQAEAIRRALRKAGVDPRTISYVETHGTGTHLGDPIEIRGLTLGYDAGDLHDPAPGLVQQVRIGSIKPNIGHLEAGAGVLGVIKALLQLHRRTLLPSITSAEPNPHIAFARGVFDVQTRVESWERRVVTLHGRRVELPRRAAVSSFGVGGANAHIVIEEAPDTDSTPDDRGVDRPSHVLALSARSEPALRRQAANLQAFLRSEPTAPLGDLCHSINTGRRHLATRAALPASSRDELLQSLDAVSARQPLRRGAQGVAAPADAQPKVAFLFTGQGSQYAGMGRELYITQPVFRDALDRCAAPFNRLLDRPLLDLLFAEEGTAEAELLNQTGYTQPALFAFQYALAEMWASWGVRPGVVMGHSVGEIAALCVAGGVSLDDGLRLIAARGRLMQALPAGGTMTSVMADESRVLAAIAGAEEQVAIAAINAPGQVVISGDGSAVAAIAARLSADGVKTKNLTVSHAFHSPLMKPMLAEYEREVRTIQFRTPRVPFVSCVEGTRVTDAVTRPEYWLRQVMDPVRFAAGMTFLGGEQVGAFVEIGPHPVLLGMGRQCLQDETRATWLPSLRRDGDTWSTLTASLSALYVQGVPVDWKGFDAPYRRARVAVPGYAFGGRQYWLKRGSRTVEIDAPSDAVDESSIAAYDIDWRPQPLTTTAPGAGQRWLVVANDERLAAALTRELRASGADVTVGHDARGAADVASGPTRIAYVVGRLSTGDAAATLAELTESLKALVARGTTARSMWVITRGAAALDARDVIDPVHRLIWGFGRTAALEYPDLWGALVDVPATVDDAAGPALVRELLAASDDDQVVLRETGRYVPRLARRELSGVRPVFRRDGTFLVTGGLGALGLRSAEWLIDRGVRHVVLTSRHVTEAAQARAKTLEARGVTVSIVPADVSQADDVDRLFAYMESSGLPVRGIVHAAGVDAVVPLRELASADIESMLASKVTAAELLHRRFEQAPLELFLCFSSISAILGSQGRAHYAAANAYLDGLMHERRRSGLPGISINWGPWRGGGMASSSHLESFERIGNRGLRPDEAIAMLDRAVGANVVSVSVMDIDWSTFSVTYQAKRPRPLVSDLARDDSRPQGPEDSSPWIAKLRGTPAESRLALLQELLRDEVAETLGFEDGASVPLDRNFYELGLDSLMMADLVGRLRARTGVSCSATLFNSPRVDALAPALLPSLALDDRIVQDAAAAAGSTPAVATPSSGADGYSPAIEPEILDFQTVAYPSRPRELSDSRWHWMFVDSARRLGREPLVWLHREEGRLVGQMGSIPVRLKIDDAQVDTGWLVDTMVLEQFRPQAIGSRLMVRAHEDQPFSLSLGQSASMREIQFRLGWKEVAPLQISQLLVRPANVLKGKVPAPAAWAADWGVRASNALRGWMSETTSLRPAAIDRFSERHTELWERVSRDIACAVVRDASYLNWKYVDQPGQDFLRLELLDAAGRLQGIAVWMFRDANDAYRYTRGFLVDIVAPFGNPVVLREVVAAACAAATAREADALLCHHVGRPLTEALRACGFRLRRPQRVLLVDPGTLEPPRLDQVLSADAWLVTHGDSDIDRPYQR